MEFCIDYEGLYCERPKEFEILKFSKNSKPNLNNFTNKRPTSKSTFHPINKQHNNIIHTK